jgi:hypothetical protein
LVNKLRELIDASSVPEVVQALIVIATYHRTHLEKENNGGGEGWALIETELRRALKAIEF